MKPTWSRICINRMVSSCFAILNGHHHESSIDLQNFEACDRYWILCRPCCRPVLQTTFSLTLIGQTVLVQRVIVGVPIRCNVLVTKHVVHGQMLWRSWKHFMLLSWWCPFKMAEGNLPTIQFTCTVSVFYTNFHHLGFQ